MERPLEGLKEQRNAYMWMNPSCPTMSGSAPKPTSHNYSVQTGEEFAIEFLRKDSVRSPSNQNEMNKEVPTQTTCEDLTGILGLGRMVSGNGSDMPIFLGERGSSDEIEQMGYSDTKNISKSRRLSANSLGEYSTDQAPITPISQLAPPISHSRSPSEPSGSRPYGLGTSDNAQIGKMKLLCSFGGRILPRPSDGKLRYVGGETRIVTVSKDISWHDLMQKTLSVHNQYHTIKYQLPGEDLDALVSVSSDEDLQNMMEEYNGLENVDGSQRLRIFLISGNESDTGSFDMRAARRNSDLQYVVAVNGILEQSLRKGSNGHGLSSPLAHGMDVGNEVSSSMVYTDKRPPALSSNFTAHFLHNAVKSPSSSPPMSPLPKLSKIPRERSFDRLSQEEDENYTILTARPPQYSRAMDELGSIPKSTMSPQFLPMVSRSGKIVGSPAKPPLEVVPSPNQSTMPERMSSLGISQRQGAIAKSEQIPLGNDLKQQNSSYDPESGQFQLSEDPIFPSIYVPVDPPKPFVLRTDVDSTPSESESDGYTLYGQPVLQERVYRSEFYPRQQVESQNRLSRSNESINSQHGLPHALSDSHLQTHVRESIYRFHEGTPTDCANIPGQSTDSFCSFVGQNTLREGLVQFQRYKEMAGAMYQATQPPLTATSTSERLGSLNLPNHIDFQEGKESMLLTGEPHKIEEQGTASNIGLGYHCQEPVSSQAAVNFIGEEGLLSPQDKVKPFINIEVQPPDDLKKSGLLQREVTSSPILESKSPNLESKIPDSHRKLPQHEDIKKLSSNFTASSQKSAIDQQDNLEGTLKGVLGTNDEETKPTFELSSRDFPGIATLDKAFDSDIKQDLANNKYQEENTSSCLLPTNFPEGIIIPDGFPTTRAGADSELSSLLKTTPVSAFDDRGSMDWPFFATSGVDGVQRTEVSLLDQDLMSYKPSKAEDASLVQSAHQNTVDGHVHVVVEDVTDKVPSDLCSSPATVPHVLHEEIDDAPVEEMPYPRISDVGSVSSESDSEDAKIDNRDIDESITDAAIAEIEAGLYGLQIIKNADLEELRELGSGTFGTVYHGKWRGSDVAIKRIKKSCFAGRLSEQERLTDDFWREAKILSKLHHPNVVAFYGIVPDGAGGTLATVTEYMVNGSLRHVLLRKDRNLDRRRRLIIAMDAAFGMEYLHSKSIVHFDLKCDNLLVNMRDSQRPICKVGDFGLSRIKRNTLVSGGVRGTLPWMAPELLNGSSSRVSEKVDVFSFGIALWEILTGEEPYANMHYGAIIGGIVNNTLRPPIPNWCDADWRRLMEECWSPDPSARPSFTEITNRLRIMSASIQPKSSTKIVNPSDLSG
ncbi:uncharacterized protein LOC18444205 [Amborella trichopoda]|uniref:Protein kinase domain-containing protein n=1 Tax=Amborella trichopoda TaxID=13333 RepID=U5D0X4_AMBTC|nr:uncharacterized protein LOC18444205 [Amborella trichopoda]ERN15910.1 hypothetical protein AMTR_s00039p00222500 [Amborella trichopoda]|eukprot:XP_006854443.1 uncharacterized protein LOC18444205 [Amborella trichopoda]